MTACARCLALKGLRPDRCSCAFVWPTLFVSDGRPLTGCVFRGCAEGVFGGHTGVRGSRAVRYAVQGVAVRATKAEGTCRCRAIRRCRVVG